MPEQQQDKSADGADKSRRGGNKRKLRDQTGGGGKDAVAADIVHQLPRLEDAVTAQALDNPNKQQQQQPPPPPGNEVGPPPPSQTQAPPPPHHQPALAQQQQQQQQQPPPHGGRAPQGRKHTAGGVAKQQTKTELIAKMHVPLQNIYLLTEEQKVAYRRARNRVAAAKCRQAKIEREAELKALLSRYEEDGQRLEERLATLETVLEAKKKKLKKDNPATGKA